MFKVTRQSLMAFLILLVSGLAAPASAFVLAPFGLSGARSLSSALIRQKPGNDFSAGVETSCMVMALYHEARGEPLIGQIAVAETIINRARSTSYPASICGVVYQNAHRTNRCQFSFACDGLSDVIKNSKVANELRQLSIRMLAIYSADRYEKRPTYFNQLSPFMTHYHRYDVHPAWSKKLVPLGQIGKHVFFRSERVVKRYKFDLTSVSTVQPRLPEINASNMINL